MKRMIFDEDHDAFQQSCAVSPAKHVTPHLESDPGEKALTRDVWLAAAAEELSTAECSPTAATAS